MEKNNYKAYIFQNEYGEYLMEEKSKDGFFHFHFNIHFAEITIDARRVHEVKEKYPKIKVIECTLTIKL